MPASLSEAFGSGQEYDSYPPSDIQQKRKKKPVRPKKYGAEVPQPQRFTAPEPKRELNVTIGNYPEEDEYLSIKNDFTGDEFCPTDYNIKPKDVQEYMFQMNKNYSDNVTNNNIINRTLSTPSSDPNLIDDDYYAYVPTSVPSNTPQPTKNNKDINDVKDNFSDFVSNQDQEQTKNRQIDPRIVDFNAKLDLILNKLGHFDEPVQENIHDIILFVIFGIFVIFILDSVYRVGKMTL